MTASVEIMTSAWATPLAGNICRVGISRGLPRRQRGYRRYPRLAPGGWMWSATDAEFTDQYETMLSALDPAKVVADLVQISGGAPVALLCFECMGSGLWCHRGLVAQWLHRTLGLEVREHGHAGFGDQHPMLCACLRARSPSHHP